MSVEYYDLGQRLRAASTGRPAPRSCYAPCLPPEQPVAVTVSQARGGELKVHAATGGASASAHGAAAFTALAQVGVDPSNPPTLIAADRRTVSTLASAARRADPGTPGAAYAALLGWWDQRVDHPGSGAVLALTRACSLRWRLGTPPSAEHEIGTWLSWLGVPGHGPEALLALAGLVSAGPTLPGLEIFRDADARSWEYYSDRLAQGGNWRRSDSRTEAAMGLATRGDAVELYESLRLRDPLVAVREGFAGNIVTGVVVACPERGPLVIESVQSLCRLRTDTDVQGWRGAAADVAHSGDPAALRVAGRLTAVTVSPTQALTLVIEDPAVRAGTLAVGNLITIRAIPVSPSQQSHGRRNLRIRYRSSGNWLAGGTPPVPRRRDVPLDVVIAAADDD